MDEPWTKLFYFETMRIWKWTAVACVLCLLLYYVIQNAKTFLTKPCKTIGKYSFTKLELKILNTQQEFLSQGYVFSYKNKTENIKLDNNNNNDAISVFFIYYLNL